VQEAGRQHGVVLREQAARHVPAAASIGGIIVVHAATQAGRSGAVRARVRSDQQ
jgi:hypothetical protein